MTSLNFLGFDSSKVTVYLAVDHWSDRIVELD